MNAKDVLRAGFQRSRMVTTMLLDDLEDAELLVRPVDSANHIAWQVGHLIVAENSFGEMIRAGSMPKLPEGFADRHGKERASSDENFDTKSEYLRVWDEQRAGTLALLDALDDDELDKPAPEQMRQIATNVGELFHLTADHEMMHTGQYSTVRRKLGKSVKF